MAKELIINASLPEVRIALLEEGRIQELLIERQSEKGIVGNIYKGKVTRVLPGMQAAFVDIGLDKAAFLYVDDIYVNQKVMGEETEIDEDEAEDGVTDGSEDSEAPAHGHEHHHDGGAEIHALGAEGSAHAPSTSESNVQEMSPEDLADALHDETAEASDEDEEGEDSEEFEGEESGDDESDDESEEDSSEESSEATVQTASAEGTDANQENSESADGAASENQVAPTGIASGAPGGFKAPAPGSMEAMAAQAKGGRRGRSRNRNRRGKKGDAPVDGKPRVQFAAGESNIDPDLVPDTFNEHMDDKGDVQSDRAAVAGETITVGSAQGGPAKVARQRPEFREPRNRDRRIKSKSLRPRAQANISDLLTEGQEVIVQVAKDPIATKGARLTCHVSLPGRHLVCMPSIDHVGVSRRIERDDERRRLRDFVEKNRPKKMGFIVRTASGGKDPESWIKQDIDYLSKLWKGIRNRADNTPPASLVYEDLNSVLRAIRDWVNEDISKIVVDSRYHYNELLEFAERFMPSLEGKIELYHGDIPIFDAYGLSAELNRSLERKVWLKSGGSIVIDQAEALVAIDVNTGRFVGKTNLEATILKTNLEAAEEIAYQMRLRNCGGMIIVDFIDMEREDNKMRVYRAMDEALKKDRARPTIQKISELGLVEMTRKRTRDTLVRSLCEPCTHCEGKGYTKSARTVAYEILREIERLGVDRDAKKILVSAHETVVDLLAIDLREALDMLEKRYNKQVYIQAILDFHNEQFEVVTDRMQGKKQAGDIARQLRIERDRTERKEKQQKRQKEDMVREDGEDDSESSQASGQDSGGDSNRDSSRDNNNRNSNNRGGRGRDNGRDSNRGGRNQNRDQNRDQNLDAPAAQNAAPTTPRGSFVIRPKAEVDPATVGEAGPIAAAGGDELADDAQPSFTNQARNLQQQQNNQPRPRPSAQDMEGMDEDQLAYLRAQAAQDAAIASLSQDGNAQGQNPQQNRNNNPRQQNGRNNRGGQGGQGGGRNQNNRNQRGGQGGQQNRNQKFRPRPSGGVGGNPGNGAGYPIDQQPLLATAGNQEASSNAPDYEVISKPEGDGSNS